MQILPGRSPLGYGPGGGRWNETGVPVIYASNVAALCFFELLCIRGHVVNTSSWQLITMELKHASEILETDSLPKGWSRRPHPVSTQQFGSKWIRECKSLSLKVPSSRLPLSAYPREFNMLISPFHKDFNSIRVVSAEPIGFEVNKW